jgi:hypothetical protein
MKKISPGSAAALVLSLTWQPACADEAPAPDKSGYSLLNPTPSQAMRAFSPEMPTKILNPFTVDAGHAQFEVDFVNYSHADSAGLRTHLLQLGDSTIKLGLTNALDLEIAPNGHLTSITRDRRTGVVVDFAQGFADTVFKTKLNLVGNDGGAFALAVVPMVKVPTAARGLGNGEVEAAIAAPAQFNLPSDFTLAVQTEVDALRRAVAPGYYANFVNIVNLGHPLDIISKDLSASVELYASTGTDRATPAVYTFDVGLAYVLLPNVQFDAGANFGLNRYAPNLSVYGGCTTRF